ncbi:MAG: hypothetical protein H6Q20_1456 [Bacteroidetes bacterium]|jgi:hypothetical protein|nr:hypothetical protein [Bacteroidota bacterium]
MQVSTYDFCSVKKRLLYFDAVKQIKIIYLI